MAEAGPATRPVDPGAVDAVRAAMDEAIQGSLRVLRTCDRKQQAEAIHSSLVLGAAPQVVVVGEVARGKSSLVNALLARPGLSPVGDDVTTAAFLTFVPPRDDLPVGAADLRFEGDRRRRVRAEEVAAWITTSGRRRTEADDFPPRGVEVAVDSGRLPGVTLVDTPGVGGLDGGHAALAASVAAGASLLLLVADAGQRLTATELGFLRRCGERVPSVVVVLAKIDRHPRSWRDVREEDQRLLGQHAPGVHCVAVLGTSSRLAEDAGSTADPGMAARLSQASGIPELLDVLTGELRDHRGVARAKALAMARSALGDLAGTLRRNRDALAGRPAAVSSLSAEKDELQALLARQARWTLDLERDMGRLQRDTSSMLAERLQEVKQRWTINLSERFWTPKGEKKQEMVAEITSELEAVVADVDRQFRDRLDGIVAAMYEDGALARQVLAGVSGPAAPPRAAGTPEDPSRRGALALLIPAGVAGGVGGVARLTVGAAGGLALLPILITPLVMGGVRGLMTAGRQELQLWLTSTIDNFARSATQDVANTIQDLKPELVIHYRAHLAARVEELKTALRAAQRASEGDAQTRQAQVDAADRSLAAVTAQLEEVERALAAHLAAGRGTPRQPAPEEPR